MFVLNLILALTLIGQDAEPVSAAKAEQPIAQSATPTVIVVVGAPGTAAYGEQFQTWGEEWRHAAEKASASIRTIGVGEQGEESDHDQLKAALAKLIDAGDAPIWLVLIGHGTFDGQLAKFNLRGPDLTPNELADWLKPVTRPVAVIDCSSASSPFINKVASRDRIVITATRSGNEQSLAHFGEYMSAAISDLTADLDKDGQVSLLEAYLTACRRVKEFYEQDSRLETEHALLDDNGDGLGTPAAWFRGLRATQKAKDGATLDGTRAHQLHLVKSAREMAMPPEKARRRDELEVKIASLRTEKEKLREDAYFDRLAPLMIELAEIYNSLDEQQSVAQPAKTPAEVAK